MELKLPLVRASWSTLQWIQVVTSQDIIYGFDKADIDIDEIVSIQRNGSNHLWVVTFRSAEEPRSRPSWLLVSQLLSAKCLLVTQKIELFRSKSMNVLTRCHWPPVQVRLCLVLSKGFVS